MDLVLDQRREAHGRTPVRAVGDRVEDGRSGGWSNTVLTLVGKLTASAVVPHLHFCHAGTSSVGRALWDVFAAARADA